MATQIKITTIRDALQLCPSKGELILDIHTCLSIVGELVRTMFAQPEVFGADSKTEIPLKAEISPENIPTLIIFRRYKEFHLHLLKFTRAESEISRVDLISKGFAN